MKLLTTQMSPDASSDPTLFFPSLVLSLQSTTLPQIEILIGNNYLKLLSQDNCTRAMK